MIYNRMTYFDVEYANSSNKSICQIGLICQSGQEKTRMKVYVNPDDTFSTICTNIHHINAGKVKNEKTFDLVWQDIEKYFINTIIVGHNVCNADLDALCKNLARYNIKTPKFHYLDTYELAQAYISPYDVPDYRLPTLCEFFDLDIDNHHDALSDTDACSRLLEAMVESCDAELNRFIHQFTYTNKTTFSPFIEKTALIREVNLLLGKIKGILADGVINELEKEYIIKWRENHDNLISKKDGRKILDLIDSILADDIVTVDEIEWLKDFLIFLTQDFSSAIETKALQELQGMIGGITADKEINIKELTALQNWLYDNSHLSGHYPYDKIEKAVKKVIKDHVITSAEKKYLTKLFRDLFNPVKQIVKKTITFADKEFCLSGDFEHGSKEDVGLYISSKKGVTHSNIRKKTDYVVVGGLGSQRYANGSYGTKVKRALELGIPVITEKQLYGEL